MEEGYIINVIKNGVKQKIKINFKIDEENVTFKIEGNEYTITASDIEDFFIYLLGCMDEENT